jgi:hypothetical protein
VVEQTDAINHHIRKQLFYLINIGLLSKLFLKVQLPMLIQLVTLLSYTFMIICCWMILKMRNVWDKSCRENQKTHFMFNNFFPKILPFMRMWKMWSSLTGHRWQSNMVRVHTHSNTYWFPMAITVSWMCLNVTWYIQCLLFCIEEHLSVSILHVHIWPRIWWWTYFW